eukprot:TRINITY_DN7815_c0_g1_i1.p1 TRINITY_DN7815_c0_g1~~TRINITY_DN7815_c0_g1_i1.p1  ORF type:complete len:311 (-),score=77.29 TRINITY_DN7815_c0_g1_i1:120-1019(-)
MIRELSLIVLISAVIVDSSALFPSTPPAIQVGATNFTELVLSKKRVLALYYAPWCGACQKFFPLWEQLRRESSQKTEFAQINCEEEGLLCKSHSITGYPTIRTYSTQTSYDDFFGARDPKEIIKWHLDSEPSAEFQPIEVSKLKEDEQAKTDVRINRADGSKRSIGSAIRLSQETFDQQISSGYWLVMFELGSLFDQEMYSILGSLQQYFLQYSSENLAECSLNHGTKGAQDWCENQVKKVDQVKVGIVNVLNSRDISERYELTGFPSFIVFENGRVMGIFGERKTFDNLKDFVVHNIL